MVFIGDTFFEVDPRSCGSAPAFKDLMHLQAKAGSKAQNVGLLIDRKQSMSKSSRGSDGSVSSSRASCEFDSTCIRAKPPVDHPVQYGQLTATRIAARGSEGIVR